MKQAIEWFDIKDVKKSPARLDFDKILHLNAYYIKAMDNHKLVLLLQEKFKELANLHQDKLKILERGVEGTKLRAKTLDELLERSRFYILDEPIKISDEANEFIKAFDKRLLAKLTSTLQSVQAWYESEIKVAVKAFMEENKLEMKQVAHVLRALIAGATISPGIFEMMTVLGKEKTLVRIKRV